MEQVKAGIAEWLDSDDIACFHVQFDELQTSSTQMQEIVSEQANALVVEAFESLRELQKEIEQHFDDPAGALNAFHKQVTKARGAVLAPVKEEADRLSKLSARWANEQEAERRREEARKAAELREQWRKENEKRAAAAVDAGASPAEVTAAREAPPPPPPMVPVPATPAAGPKTRSNWKGWVSDPVKFLEAIVKDAAEEKRYPLPKAIAGLREDSKGRLTNTWINAAVRNSEGSFKMPGVSAENDAGLTRGGRRG
ncbi:MAG: hypothetical protein OXC11_12250 [Rhodospirillales bacterium]|nr:hypothetical protein [Rhodospirillales bacterium]